MSDAGATAALKGLDYQILASIWVVLTLWPEDDFRTFVIEPPSGEDLELEAEQRTVGLTAPGGAMQIQIKRNSHGPWTPGELKSMMETRQGAGARDRADRLLRADPALRYLLITDMQPTAVSMPLKVESVLDRPGGTGLPATLAEVLPADAIGRVGILVIDEKRAALELKEMLRQVCGVPVLTLDACLYDLKQAVAGRIRGIIAGQWTRADIERAIRAHGGLFDGGEDIVCYVQPCNYASIVEKLRERGAVLLEGTPGTGKSLTARYLCHRHRIDHGYLPQVATTPQSLRDLLSRPGPMIIHVDDPFGQYGNPGPHAVDWPNVLRDALSTRRPDHLIVISTRAAVLARMYPGTPPEELSRVRVTVTEAEYSRDLIWTILKKRLRYHQKIEHLTMARQVKQDVLSELAAPLAMSRFAARLSDLAKADKQDVKDLIATSTVAALTDEVAKSASNWGQDAVICSTVVWGLLKARLPLTDAELRQARDDLRQELGRAPELRGFATFLERDRFLAGSSEQWHAHPKVIEGLERVIAGQEAAEDAIRCLASARLHRQDADGAIALLATVADILPGALAKDLRRRLQPLLVERVLRSEARFQDLSNLEVLGDSAAIATRVAAHCRHPSPFQLNNSNLEPLPARLGELIATDTDAQSVLVAFMDMYLDATFFVDVDKFHDFAASIPFDASEIVVETTLSAIRSSSWAAMELTGYVCRTIPAALPRLLDAIREAYVSLAKSDAETRDQNRRASDEEGDAAWARSLAEDGPPDFIENGCLAAVITAERASHGWQVLLEKVGQAGSDDEGAISRINWTYAWVTSIESAGADTPEELRALFDLAPSWDRYNPLSWIRKNGDRAHLPSVLDWVQQHPGDADILRTAVALAEGRREDALLEIFEGLPLQHRAAMICALPEDAPIDELLPGWSQSIPEAGALRLLASTLPSSPPKASPGSIPFLEELVRDGPHAVALAALTLLRTVGPIPAELVRIRLADEDPDFVASVLDAVTPIADAETQVMAQAALSHPRAAPREAALTALWTIPEERPGLLRLAEDRSAKVRMKLVKLIEGSRWEPGIPTLIHLLRDQRDYDDDYPKPDYDVRHDIARAAATALGQLPLNVKSLKAVEVFLREASTANPDLTVHRQLIEVMKTRSALAVTGLLLDLVGRRTSPDPLLRRFRVAAAKELLTIVQEVPDVRSLLTADVLKPLIRDPDPIIQALTVRVAAITGTMTDMDMSSMTELHQALWILQRAAVGDRNAVSSATTLLNSNHAVTSLATWLAEDGKLPDKDSENPREVEAGVRAWLEDLEPDESVARQIFDVLEPRNSNS